MMIHNVFIVTAGQTRADSAASPSPTAPTMFMSWKAALSPRIRPMTTARYPQPAKTDPTHPHNCAIWAAVMTSFGEGDAMAPLHSGPRQGLATARVTHLRL